MSIKPNYHGKSADLALAAMNAATSPSAASAGSLPLPEVAGRRI